MQVRAHASADMLHIYTCYIYTHATYIHMLHIYTCYIYTHDTYIHMLHIYTCTHTYVLLTAARAIPSYIVHMYTRAPSNQKKYCPLQSHPTEKLRDENNRMRYSRTDA